MYTEPKKPVFILKQCLSNCAKYCPDCRGRMELTEERMILEDNGSGIPTHKLSRVTEWDVTGSAGRSW